MFKKESKYLLFDDQEWYYHLLDNGIHLITLRHSAPIEQIHASAQCLDSILKSDLTDLTVAYDSIGIFSRLDSEELFRKLSEAKPSDRLKKKKQEAISLLELPICYEYGRDLKRVADHNECSVDQVIEIHLAGTYQVAMIGFQPGFVYAAGLDDRLYCPRKAEPERTVPAGSVGIGGIQTGIYSFDSPGGWNIIGRTPAPLFDKMARPPVKIPLGGKIQFFRISKEEFLRWSS